MRWFSLPLVLCTLHQVKLIPLPLSGKKKKITRWKCWIQLAAIVGYPIVTGTPVSPIFKKPALRGWMMFLVPLGFFPENVTIRPAGPDTVYPAPGIPFGLSFLGTAFSDFDLIGFGYAYEQATKTRLARKAYPAAIPRTQLKDIVSKRSSNHGCSLQMNRLHSRP